MSAESIEVEGRVVETYRGDFYKVVYTLGGVERTALVKRAGRLIKANLRLLVGDSVVCELSVFDPSRGRVVWRGARRKQENP